MNLHLCVRGLAVALALLAAGCGSSRSFRAEDREAIDAAGEAWRVAAAARDTASMGALYARDAVLLPEHAAAIRGRAAIEDFFDAYPTFTELETVRLEIEGAGDLAYAWGTYSMEITQAEPDSSLPERGKFLEIWRRQGDGNWLIDRAMFTSDLPIVPAN